ncbi:hypothetical protein E1262_27160 [Jiangella aurantiaca]|uniref:Uncharacterized protein n=1 Tax=Jiangella aurantiaca TaxID=2530373 RepID=A0A4R4ZZI8_9ACTN|nr:hypothetical protein [Jiangella aurantiaca]TDD64771.1 hypothetical protein E1262_27160 [Jiangella aurantiaca]
MVADAWLSAPTDVGLYTRLVTAVLERRAYVQPDLDTEPEPVVAPATQPDEVLDELAQLNPPRSVGESLSERE